MASWQKLSLYGIVSKIAVGADQTNYSNRFDLNN